MKKFNDAYARMRMNAGGNAVSEKGAPSIEYIILIVIVVAIASVLFYFREPVVDAARSTLNRLTDLLTDTYNQANTNGLTQFDNSVGNQSVGATSGATD
jgi:uncharacterized protein (UPF0333 family)